MSITPVAVYPGGWYAAALPSGERAAIRPVQKVISTHGADVPYPDGDEPLFVDISNVGGFKIAGKGHYSNNSYEWINGALAVKPTACGNFSVIYDLLGILHISDCSIGVNGWRYPEHDGTPEGRLVTGDNTYGTFNGLNEWTQIAPDLWIGQGHDAGGICVSDAGTLRVLQAGACYDVKARWAGDSVALAFYDVQPDGLTSYVYQTTLAELRALPLAAATVPVVPQPAVPPIQPAPAPVAPAPIPEPVPVPDQTPTDVHNITFVDNPADLASWAETARITSVDLSTGRICVDHDKRSGPNAWPDAPFGDGGTGTCQYTLGLAMNIGGKWFASAVIQFWQGRDLAAGGDVSGVASEWYYSDRWAPLTGHQPAAGELVAWFVAAGNLRDNTRIGVRERSNFVFVPFGQNYAASGTPIPAPVPVPTPAPVPAPIPEPDTMPDPRVDALLVRLAALEADYLKRADIAGMAKHGDPVTVAGTIPGLSLSAKAVKWSGTIS